MLDVEGRGALRFHLPCHLMWELECA
jgi:hypothetical protein